MILRPHRHLLWSIRLMGVFLWPLLASTALAIPTNGQHPPLPIRTALTVVLDNNYPPYIFLDNAGHLQGILPDQWALWEQKTGVKVNLKAMDWADAQQFMQDGKADVIDTMFSTPVRRSVYDFTPPYAQIEVPVFAHKDLGGITDVASLQGFTIGVKSGDAVVETLKAQGIQSLKEYPSYEAIIAAAKNGEIKVFSVDQPAAIYYLYKFGIADEFRKSFILYTGEFHRAVMKGHPELLKLVQGGFSRISPHEYRILNQKWMGTPFLFRNAVREWAPWLLVALTGILLLVIINVVLRRQVRARTAELRQALGDLQRSQKYLQSILKVAPVGIGVVVDRKMTEANDHFCDLSGYSSTEIIGQSTASLYATPEEFERVGSILYPQIAANGIGALEVLGRQKSGTVHQWWLSGAPLDSAHPERGIIFAVLDITERKQAEEELRTSHEYFSTVFDSISEAIFIGDPITGNLLDVNARMLDMYGFHTRAEALATGLGPMCAGQPPYTQEEAWARIQKAYAAGPQCFEWLAQHRDGHLFWVEINISCVKFGSTDRMIVTARDITERKTAEEERQQYERRIQDAQRLESLGVLAGGIAHDFNNLLAAILGNIDLALLSIPQNLPACNDLRTAVMVTHRAADLARQMLACSGNGHSLVGPVDLPALLRDTVHMIHTSIPKTATVHFQLPDSMPTIQADATQMRQVIMNLVLNAAEALEQHPGTIGVSAGSLELQGLPSTQLWPREPLPPGSYAYIEVTDTGVGIPPESLSKIFDPFFSTRLVGRGLGLAAVLGIVRGHKGAIQVDSTPGKGSTFRILFPVFKPSV